MTSKRWSKGELEYLKNNYESESIESLIEYFGRSINSIRVKANRLGLEKNRNKTNTLYFDEINSEEKAYWLGFIYADGYVTVNEYGYSFGVELSTKDKGHLVKLKECMDSDSPISDRVRSNGVEVSSFRVYRKELVFSLSKVGVFPNKTFTMRMPNIQESLQRHFIRGYFDGDGHVSLYKRNTYGYNIRTGFVCGTIDFTNDISTILNNKLELKNKKSIYSESERIHSFQTTNKHDALLVLDYLYKDSNIHLDRKYNKYLEILEFIDR